MARAPWDKEWLTLFGAARHVGGGSPPDPPDPKETAAAQGQTNRETALAQARLNMVDRVTPYGTVTYERIPGTGGTERIKTGMREKTRRVPIEGSSTYDPQYRTVTDPRNRTVTDPRNRRQPQYRTVTEEVPVYEERQKTPRFRQKVELTPEQQQRFDLQQQLGTDLTELGVDQLGRIRESVSTPFGLEGLPQRGEVPTFNPGDYADERQRVEQALYDRASQYLDPRFEQERESMRTQLINSGFRPGTEAFEEQMNNFSRRRQQAYGDARDRAITGAGQEQSRLFGMDVTGYNAALDEFRLRENARERALQERLLERSQPLNEMAAFLGTGPGVQMPQFTNVPQTGIAPPDYQGAVNTAYQGELQNYQTQQANRASTMGAVAGLAGTVGGAMVGGPFGAAIGGGLGSGLGAGAGGGMF